jgi:uncharacterized protein (TIRG00374 family)
VRAQGLPFTFRNAVRLGLVGFFYNTCLPGAVGGDLIKATFIAREQSRRTVAVATVIVDRLVGLWGLVWVVALLGGGVWFLEPDILRDRPALPLIIRTAWVLLAVSVVGWVLAGFLPERRAHRFSGRLRGVPKIGGMLSEFWRAIWMYRNRPGSILVALSLTLVGHTCTVLAFFCAALTFQPRDQPPNMPTLVEHYLTVPIGMTAEAIPLTPGGVGIGEAAYSNLYGMLGFPERNGFLGCFGRRLLAWLIGLAGYLVYLNMKRELPVAKDQPQTVASQNEA